MNPDDNDDYWTRDSTAQPAPTTPAAPAVRTITGIQLSDPLEPPFSSDPAYPPQLADWFSQSGGHYLLIDAARCDHILGQDDLETLAKGHRCRSLFLNGEFAHAGPWLIDLDRQDPADDARFLQLFFQKLWGQRAGIFIRTDAEFDRLFSHLRTFAMVGDNTVQTDAETKPSKWFFRYWDPLVAGIYFPGVTDRAERVDQLLKTPDRHDIDMLIEDGSTRAISLTAPQRDTAPAGPLMARKPLILDARDKVILDEVAFRALGLELGQWFVTAFPDRLGDLTENGQNTAAHHVVTTGRALGFRLKEEYSYLAHVMVYFGGWFFETSANPRLNNILFDTHIPNRQIALEGIFSDAWSHSVPAALSQKWPEIRTWLSHIPDSDRISPDTLKSLNAEFLRDHRDAVAAILAGARPAAKAAGFSILQEGQHILISLILGHRYQDDPFHPWVGLAPKDALNMAWKSLFNAL